MEQEIKMTGFAFMGSTGTFKNVYGTEREARKMARKAYAEGNADLLGTNPDGTVCSVASIMRVMEIDTTSLAVNAVQSMIDYVKDTYDDFEAGLDDAAVYFNPDLMNVIVPYLKDNMELGGITKKGEVMYEYDLKTGKTDGRR